VPPAIALGDRLLGFATPGRTRLLVALGLALRLVAVLTFPVYPLVDNTEDTEIYDFGAKSLAAGQGYRWGDQPTAFFPIGWPLLLSMAYRVGGVSADTGQWLNFGFSIVLLFAGWALGRRLLGAAGGRLVAIVLALAPHHVVYPAFLMSETSFTALFTASLLVLASDAARLRNAAGAGLLMGMATLVRGPSLVYPLFALAAARFVRGASIGRTIVVAVVFGLALLVPLLPWGARNHAVFGRWVLVANDGGMNFLMGNHPGATGARQEPPEGLPNTGDEVADDREGYRRGLEFIRERPLEFVALWPKKLVRLCAPAPLLTYRAELRAKWPEPLALALLAFDQLLHLALWAGAALGVVGALRAWRAHRRAGGGACPGDPSLRFPLLAIGLWVLVHLAFLGGARYFYPMMPLLVIVAVRGVTRPAADAAAAPARLSAGTP
jgi:4-amino-4-deoxy-L-arabinose transferase-like glycosyltransferase